MNVPPLQFGAYGDDMKIARRILGIVLAFFASFSLVMALVTRVAYNTAFDTDTYVHTVTAIAENPNSLSRISDFISNSFTESADLGNPQLAPLFRRAGIDQEKFESELVSVLQNSVTKFMQSDLFIKMWADTNRAAHAQLMKLIKSDTTVTQDFMVELGPIVKTAAESIQDPNGYISKIIPLKTFIPSETKMQFKLVQASGVEDLRTAVDIAGKARTGLLISALVFYLFAFNVFGSKRASLRLVSASLAVVGIFTMLIRAIGKSVVGNLVEAEAKSSATTIYSITTSPLAGYAVFVLLLGAVGFAATFYRRTETTN